METVVERELGQRLDVGDGDARMASDQRRPQRLLGVVEERAPLRPSVTEFYRVLPSFLSRGNKNERNQVLRQKKC